MWCGWFPSPEWRDSWGYTGGNEILQHDYITSWDINGNSELISLWAGYRPGEWREWMSPLAWLDMPCFSRAYWKVELSTQNQGPNEWVTVIGETGIVNSQIIGYVQGPTGMMDWQGGSINQDYDGDTHTGTMGMCGGPNDCCYNTDMFSLNYGDAGNSTTIFPSAPLQFRIKGQWWGGIRVSLIVKYQVYSHDPGGDCACSVDNVIVSDEAYLYSGQGSIEILDNPQAPPGLEDYFEEGQTVVTRLNTGAAGSGAGHGWLVTVARGGTGIPSMVWSHSGTTYTTDANGNFIVGENLVNYDISWTVPPGWYNPSGSNDIVVVLTNEIIQQDRDDTFTLYEGGFEDCPGETTVEILNPSETGSYPVGYTIQIKATANINEQATPPHNQIWGFEINAYSSNPYHTFEQGYQTGANVISCGGTCRYALFEILIDQDTTDMTIKARAWSGDPNAGGLPGGYGETAVSIGEDPVGTLTLTVVVKTIDNGIHKVVRGATVTIGDQFTEETDRYGTVILTGQTPGPYFITAEKSGYHSASDNFDLMNGNTVCTLYISAGDDLMTMIIGIIIPIIVLVMFCVFAVLIVPPWRYIILIIGISITALLFYLFLFTNILSGLGF